MISKATSAINIIATDAEYFAFKRNPIPVKYGARAAPSEVATNKKVSRILLPFG